MASEFWSKLSRWRLRAGSDCDMPLKAPAEPVFDITVTAVRDVPAPHETTALSNTLVLGQPAISALDELFDKAGIDRDLGGSPS